MCNYIFKLAACTYENIRKYVSGRNQRASLNALTNSDSKYLTSKFCNLMV